MPYLLDANVFISAKNLHYGFDFCPAFWEWILQEHRGGKVFSIEKVGDELAAGQDDLSDWAAGIEDGFFLKPDATTLHSFAVVSNWVTGHPKYSAAAKNTFLQNADYYLISQALAEQHIVVTHERLNASIHRVKIPGVCLGVGVNCITPFEMLRRERARFILETRAA
ncbi:MAG: hypothetical protein UZ16_OP3001001387 [Candidatus Hinthialibacteria bacterium OLB16]|nr:MAG: hypothetical protein UZ16_OP3001001387 [Candidatus Hinthialibacteria bacterium OLB16]MBK7496459.1 DUF4411 family protein [Candidatus Omnitrophota bacterium]